MKLGYIKYRALPIKISRNQRKDFTSVPPTNSELLVNNLKVGLQIDESVISERQTEM